MLARDDETPEKGKKERIKRYNSYEEPNGLCPGKPLVIFSLGRPRISVDKAQGGDYHHPRIRRA